MRIVRHLLQASRARLVASILWSIVNGALSIAVVAVLRDLVETPSMIGVGLIFGLAALGAGAGMLSQLTASHAVSSVVAALRIDLLGRLARVSQETIEDFDDAAIQTALNEDIGAVSDAAGHLPSAALGMSITLAGLAYLTFISPPLGAVLLATLALSTVITQGLMRAMTTYFLRLRTAAEKVHRLFHDVVQGGPLLRASPVRAQVWLDGHVRPAVDDARALQDQANLRWSLGSNWGALSTLWSIGLVSLFIVLFDPAATDLIAPFALTILILRGGVQSIMTALGPLGRANVALGRLDALTFEAPPLPPAQASGFSRMLVKNGVFVRKAAREGDWTFELRCPAFEVYPGEVIMITGGNGEGKSTLLRLLSGLYALTAGTCEAQDRYGRVLELHDTVAPVFAEAHVFGWPVSHAGADIPEPQVRALLERFGLSRQVAFCDGGWRHQRLSTGQRKRLALIEAILDGRPVLVLDEWAAEQDPHFKRFFYEELLEELTRSGRTLVLVTHDDRYFDVANRCYEVRGGRVEERVRSTHPGVAA